MKISYDWLKAWVAHTLSAERVGELLSRHAVTLDGLSRTRADLAPIVVARVVASEKVPDTRLSFNKVDDGSGQLLDVVCGAPNVEVGALYPFARVGTLLPNGLKIEARKIRGLTSHGMLCSADEIKLGSEHDGIYTLHVKVAPGTPILDALPLGDTVLELDVLPNRPDLLSHLGVARELSALTNKPLRVPPELNDIVKAPKAVKGAKKATAKGVTVQVDDLKGCPRYVAVVIRGVKVGPSPEWLATRVMAMGGRSINNVVDATNYMLHGMGQPVHAFDLAKLGKSSIVVRKARAGESLVTLDGTTRKLDPSMTIIADGENATALAGVMGGRASEVTDATTDLLVEVARFDPRGVRAVRRAVGLSTDASYRFERGVDGAMTADFADHCAGLIVKVAGGTIESLIDVGSAAPKAGKPVALSPATVERLLGTSVKAPEITKLLKSIGFVVKAGKSLSVAAPSWRHDVSRDVDLIEEIARLRGYDSLPDSLGASRPSTVPDHSLWHAYRRVRDALVALGLCEARSMPFTKGDATPHARVANPLAADEPFLRTSIIDTLARRAEHNLNRSEGNVRLFEVGHVFRAVPAALPQEEVCVGALVMGASRPPHFKDPQPPAYDQWHAKGISESIAHAAFPGEPIELAPGSGQALWVVRAGARAVGRVTRVALDKPVWASDAWGVEIALGPMPSTPPAQQGKHKYVAPASTPRHFTRYAPIPVMPAASFDVALVVPNDMPAASVERAMRAASGEMLESVTLFDEFRGAGVPDGKRSLAWRLTFRHPERTLRDKEIDGRRAQLLKTLEKELGVVPRAG